MTTNLSLELNMNEIISIVTYTFNEEKNINKLLERIDEILDKFRKDTVWKKEGSEWKLHQQVQKN